MKENHTFQVMIVTIITICVTLALILGSIYLQANSDECLLDPPAGTIVQHKLSDEQFVVLERVFLLSCDRIKVADKNHSRLFINRYEIQLN